MWSAKRLVIVGLVVAGLATAGIGAATAASASENRAAVVAQSHAIAAKPVSAVQAQPDQIKPQAYPCQARMDKGKNLAFAIGCGPANRWWRVWAYCRKTGSAGYRYSGWYKGKYNGRIACWQGYRIYSAGIQYH
jgi:hypothetical protein